jgi:hypothetical protein
MAEALIKGLLRSKVRGFPCPVICMVNTNTKTKTKNRQEQFVMCLSSLVLFYLVFVFVLSSPSLFLAFNSWVSAQNTPVFGYKMPCFGTPIVLFCLCFCLCFVLSAIVQSCPGVVFVVFAFSLFLLS